MPTRVNSLLDYAICRKAIKSLGIMISLLGENLKSLSDHKAVVLMIEVPFPRRKYIAFIPNHKLADSLTIECLEGSASSEDFLRALYKKLPMRAKRALQ